MGTPCRAARSVLVLKTCRQQDILKRSLLASVSVSPNRKASAGKAEPGVPRCNGPADVIFLRMSERFLRGCLNTLLLFAKFDDFEAAYVSAVDSETDQSADFLPSVIAGRTGIDVEESELAVGHDL